MNFQDLLKQSRRYVHAIRFNDLLSLSHRLQLSHVLEGAIVLSVLLIVFSVASDMFDISRFVGFTLLASGCWLVLFAIDAYVFSYYLREFSSSPSVTFELAEVVLSSDRHDLTAGLLVHPHGDRILRRLGLSIEDLESFYADRRETVSTVTVKDSRPIDVAQYAIALYKTDEDLRTFLFTRGVTEEVFVGAVEWVHAEIVGRKQRYRWWSLERLREIPGIGKDWSFGKAYHLEQYSRPATSLVRVGSILRDYYRKEADRLESILSRGRSANAILVGEEGSGLRDAVAVFVDRIYRQTITPELEHFRVYILNTDLLIADHSSKKEFEEMLVRIFDEALKTENIVIVIEHLPTFLANAAELGSNPASLIEGYLEDPRLHVVATSSPDAYYDHLEHEPRLKRWFDRVTMEHDDRERVIWLLEELAMERERRDIFVTYPAIQSVYDNAKRYLTGGVMPNVALDLLEEVISLARTKQQDRVTRRSVDNVVGEKTGVPTGEASKNEKERLLNLEDILHSKIVGQDAAVVAVSDALRRSRSGIGNPDRPLGVFLFLGPTGVGKTETAKVLANTFFDGHDDIVRFDMTEFSEGDSLSRLIGNVGTQTTGMLSSAITDNPYSVLLLDEFEKTTKDVHNLFLQIFDEGVFHDAYDSEVNCRNMIIIATSNAASETIHSLIKENEKLAPHKNEIIDGLISSHTFRPELINRFDEVVLFHPLSHAETAAVAERELAKLQLRLNKRGIAFEITQTLIDYLVEHGYDERFGARAIRRIIVSDIEKVISHKLLTGEIKKGDTAIITEKDLTSLAQPGVMRKVAAGLSGRASHSAAGSEL